MNFLHVANTVILIRELCVLHTFVHDGTSAGLGISNHNLEITVLQIHGRQETLFHSTKVLAGMFTSEIVQQEDTPAWRPCTPETR